jgi:glycosyltransferase involved in cell wall biosynthesis
MVVHAYYPLGETRVQREAEALVEAGYDVDVICLRDDGEQPRERYRGVEIHRLPVRIARSSLLAQLGSYLHFLARATLQLTQLHLRRHYGSVQVHNLPDFLVICAILPKVQRIPVVLDLHDLMPEFFAGRFGPGRMPIVARLVRVQERLSCRFADHIITVSEHWRRALLQRGVPEYKCSVVMNVADERLFTRRPEPTMPASRSDPTFRLIYHGTVTMRYGLDLAVRAVGLLRGEIPGIHLTILGRGDAMPALVELRDRLGLRAHVELRDELLLADELPTFIAGADLGVVPYRNDVFTDGLLPTKLMEYAAIGLPCVASRTTTIEAYFADAMVELAEPDDVDDLARAIRELHAEPQRLAALANRSVHFTERHSWSRIGPDYVALLRRLADARRAATTSPPPPAVEVVSGSTS